MKPNKYVTFVVALGAWLFACAASAQQNSIEAFNVAAQGGRVIVRITTKQPLAAPPASFTVTQPARIALDFPNTANGLGRTTQEINEGELRGMNVVQVGDRTRMVLNLRNMVTYETQVDGNTVNIVLTPVTVSQTRPTPRAERFAEGAPDQKHAIRDVDFRRGRTGEGRVVIELADANTGIDIRQQGQQLIVDFLSTVAAGQPAQAPRRRRLRHAGLDDQHVPAGRERAHGDRAEGPVGAQRLPDRHAVRGRGEADPVRPEQARAGHAGRLPGREAVAQLPERGGPQRPQRDRRLHRPQHHHERHGAGEPHAAAQGRAVGPGARHHPADARPRHAQERQRGLDRAAGRAGDQGEARARGGAADLGARAAAHRDVPAQLHEGRGARGPAARRRAGRRRRGHQHPDPVQARQRRGRPADQHALRAGHPVAARDGAQDDRDHRHPGAAGDDRGADRRGDGQVQPDARRAARL